MVKNLPALHETRVQSLGHEDPLEKGLATYSNILAWRISWTEELGSLQSMGSQRDVSEWLTHIHECILQYMSVGFYCGWNTKNLKQLLLRKIQMHDSQILSVSFFFFLYLHANIHLDQWGVTEVASVTLRENSLPLTSCSVPGPGRFVAGFIYEDLLIPWDRCGCLPGFQMSEGLRLGKRANSLPKS